ncbi:hypothetical protein [Bacillus cereus]|uniref:hypothetical protein n=1 Tax=Bacillus cereus TaxID=1396 RepID=UPI0003A39D77|nr:hypothetical protein [Bacillus cereus]
MEQKVREYFKAEAFFVQIKHITKSLAYAKFNLSFTFIGLHPPHLGERILSSLNKIMYEEK